MALVVASLLRGAYHLYQGWGAGLGNAAMGLVFGYAWRRTGRLWPLIIAHGVIDTVAFVGYVLLAAPSRLVEVAALPATYIHFVNGDRPPPPGPRSRRQRPGPPRSRRR